MSGLERNPIEGFYAINLELKKYSEKLLQKPQVIAANKMDLPQSRENYDKLKDVFEKDGYEVIPVSGATGQGIRELIQYLVRVLAKTPKTTVVEEVKEYKLVEEEPFEISRTGQDFYVTGKRVERLVAMTDLENESAVKRLQRSLKKMGLDDVLKAKGIKPGDTVKIGNSEFYYVE